MKEHNISKKVNTIFSTLLNRDITEGEEITLSQENSWHSLKLLELVFLLEEEFLIKLFPVEIAQFDKVGMLKQFIKNKIGGCP